MNIVDIASTPGNMNVRSDSPPVPAEASPESPVPSTNRNSTGWMSDTTRRERSCQKRIISRCHTIVPARISCANPSRTERVRPDAGRAARASIP